MTDVDLALGVMPSVDEVLAMERAKTSVYSFEAPLQSGACSRVRPTTWSRPSAPSAARSGSPTRSSTTCSGVRRRGRDRKSVLGDLREGKRTMLIAHAATTDCWDDIAPYLGDPDLTEERAAELRATLETCGARSAAESRIAEHAALAPGRARGAAVRPRDLDRPTEGLVTELLERVR